MPRLFIGIGLPPEYQELLPTFTQGLNSSLRSSVRWTKPENFHLTLKFLGDTDQTRIPAITDTLKTVTLPAFSMQAGSAGVFPRVQHPRVVWLGLRQGTTMSTELAAMMEDALSGIGIAREKKRFRPHLTLGRIRKLASDDWAGVLEKAKKQPWPEFTVNRFTLWQSELNPTGAVHTVLKEFSLA